MARVGEEQMVRKYREAANLEVIEITVQTPTHNWNSHFSAHTVDSFICTRGLQYLQAAESPCTHWRRIRINVKCAALWGELALEHKDIIQCVIKLSKEGHVGWRWTEEKRWKVAKSTGVLVPFPHILSVVWWQSFASTSQRKSCLTKSISFILMTVFVFTITPKLDWHETQHTSHVCTFFYVLSLSSSPAKSSSLLQILSKQQTFTSVISGAQKERSEALFSFSEFSLAYLQTLAVTSPEACVSCGKACV